jgi:hypothetical protein
VAIPQKTNSVINNDVCVWPIQEISDGVSVNDCRGCETVPGRLVTGRCWSSLLVEIVEAAKRIDKSPLKKRKKLFGLPQEPSVMAG